MMNANAAREMSAKNYDAILLEEEDKHLKRAFEKIEEAVHEGKFESELQIDDDLDEQMQYAVARIVRISLELSGYKCIPFSRKFVHRATGCIYRQFYGLYICWHDGKPVLPRGYKKCLI